MTNRYKLRPPVVKVSENDVEKAVCDILRLKQLYPLRQHVGLFKTRDDRYITAGERGIPDWCIPRFFVEVKRPGGHLSLEQSAKIDQLRTFWKLETAVVSSPEELIEWLREHPDL